MAQKINPEHPLVQMFRDKVAEQTTTHLGSTGYDDVEAYLTSLLVDFVRMESVFSVRDSEGKPLRSVIEMVAEADVRLNAASFERERQVHKHIGDFILFWTGVAPDYLSRHRATIGTDLVCDYTRQGQESYYVVSTFDHPPYDAESSTFRKLSREFDGLSFVLGQVGRSFGLGAH
ncbi:MAG: hypothetical protein JSS65_09330 [Armatimonadetes bacterium]|nr:hypothetical protein [Armatimonadota bacterium]